MKISGWLFLLQQVLGGACMLLCIGRCLGQPMRPTKRLWAGSLVSGALVALTVNAPLPLRLLSLSSALPAALFTLRGVRPGPLLLLACPVTLCAAGWSLLMRRWALPGSLGLLFVCGLLLLLPRFLPQPGTPRRAALTIVLDGRRVRALALYDTGNLLRDPATGLPVIVVPRKLMSRLTLMPPSPMLRQGMRLMSARTAAGSMLLTLVHPDAVFLGSRRVQATLGVPPDPRADFDVLLPAALLAPRFFLKTGGSEYVDHL